MKRIDWRKKLDGLKAVMRYYCAKCAHSNPELENRVLWRMSWFSKHIFKREKEEVIKKNIQRIRKQKRIKIAFLAYTGSMWTVDCLYQCLRNDARFETDIIIAKAKMDTEEAAEFTYEEAKKYFSETLGYSIKTEKSADLDMDSYDLLFYLTPYLFYEKQVNMIHRKMRQLVCYMPYCYMTTENTARIRLPIYTIAWKVFCDTDFYVRMIRDNIDVYSDNAVYEGFPKMDEFYTMPQPPKRNKKTIIYAPHHTVNFPEHDKEATFDKNYREILALAEKYNEETFWYVKPHPVLRSGSIAAGLFKNLEEYDSYMKKWDDLDNAKVVPNGSYVEIFKESDAMITDSLSFLVEYQFTHKPLLRLESGGKLNEFCEGVRDILYRCDGEDIESIEKFITETVIGEKDEMAETRKRFFDCELDYFKRFGELAGPRIYRILKSELTGSD